MKNITLSREVYRRLLDNYPLCSDRFIENLLTIALNRAGFRGDTRATTGRSAQFDRHILLTRYRSGALRLKPLIQSAMETLDDKTLELFIRNLFRKETAGKAEVDIAVAICYLDDTEKLTQRSSSDASKRLSLYLQQRGVVPSKFTAGAYRKCIERLRRIGVKLLCL
jgi:hypothetical protein